MLRGIKSVSEFTKKTPMYAIYLNVDSYAHNGNYYVWAEEINVQGVGLHFVIVPTGNKSNPTMSVNEGTIVVLTTRNPTGFPMGGDEIISKVNDAVRTYARHLEIFAERNGGLDNADVLRTG